MPLDGFLNCLSYLRFLCFIKLFKVPFFPFGSSSFLSFNFLFYLSYLLFLSSIPYWFNIFFLSLHSLLQVVLFLFLSLCLLSFSILSPVA
jgi:hypothetical protein